jgi:hypothetical protein
MRRNQFLGFNVSNEGGTMKKAILALLLSVLVLMPNVSSSRAEPTSARADVDKLHAQHLKTKFRNIREDLSRVRNDLETISTSMTAHESVQSYLIKRSYEDIGSMAGICRYMEKGMDGLLLVEEDKLSYYCYLQEYGIERMGTRSNEYLKNIKKRRAKISDSAALRLLDRATENIRLSSGLIDNVVEMLQQCSDQEGPASHH